MKKVTDIFRQVLLNLEDIYARVVLNQTLQRYEQEFPLIPELDIEKIRQIKFDPKLEIEECFFEAEVNQRYKYVSSLETLVQQKLTQQAFVSVKESFHAFKYVLRFTVKSESGGLAHEFLIVKIYDNCYSFINKESYRVAVSAYAKSKESFLISKEEFYQKFPDIINLVLTGTIPLV